MDKTYDHITTLLNKSNVQYWLDSGTLLGLMRDGRLLSNDEDIDLGIWEDEENNLKSLFDQVQDAGFKIRTVKYKDIIYKYKFVPADKAGLVIDINIFRLHDNHAWCPINHINSNVFKRGSVLYYLIALYRFPFLWYSGNKTNLSIDAWPLTMANTVGCWWIPAHFFNDIVFNDELNAFIPRDWVEYLEFRYGDWKKPTDDWLFWHDDKGVRHRVPD